MRHLLFVFAVCMAAPSLSFDAIFECVEKTGAKRLTNIAKEADGCLRLGPTDEEIAQFRKRIKIGDRATHGLIIEVKPPLAKIQAGIERWYRIDELLPAPPKE